MKTSNIPKKIIDRILNSKNIITSEVLAKNYKLKPLTASNYLSRLKRDGIITRIGRGEYINSQKSKLILDISPKVRKIHEIIEEQSPFLEFIIWSIFNLKEFYHNVPTKNYLFIESKEMFELMSIKEILFEHDLESIINPKPKDFEEVLYRIEIPIILFKRKNSYGVIKINGIQTPILERCILDLYYYITRKKLNYPIEEVNNILINAINTGAFNFSFADRYVKLRNIEFDFLLIFSKLHQKYPNLIPIRYLRRNLKLNENLKLFFGEDCSKGIF